MPRKSIRRDAGGKGGKKDVTMKQRAGAQHKQTYGNRIKRLILSMHREKNSA
jgi:hypothetical protein